MLHPARPRVGASAVNSPTRPRAAVAVRSRTRHRRRCRPHRLPSQEKRGAEGKPTALREDCARAASVTAAHRGRTRTSTPPTMSSPVGSHQRARHNRGRGGVVLVSWGRPDVDEPVMRDGGRPRREHRRDLTWPRSARGKTVREDREDRRPGRGVSAAAGERHRERAPCAIRACARDPRSVYFSTMGVGRTVPLAPTDGTGRMRERRDATARAGSAPASPTEWHTAESDFELAADGTMVPAGAALYDSSPSSVATARSASTSSTPFDTRSGRSTSAREVAPEGGAAVDGPAIATLARVIDATETSPARPIMGARYIAPCDRWLA